MRGPRRFVGPTRSIRGLGGVVRLIVLSQGWQVIRHRKHEWHSGSEGKAAPPRRDEQLKTYLDEANKPPCCGCKKRLAV